MQRAHEAETERKAVLARMVYALQEDWVNTSGLDWVPLEEDIEWLIGRYGYEIADRAMLSVARKLRSKELPPRSNRWLPYLKATARNMAENN